MAPVGSADVIPDVVSTDDCVLVGEDRPRMRRPSNSSLSDCGSPFLEAIRNEFLFAMCRAPDMLTRILGLESCQSWPDI